MWRRPGDIPEPTLAALGAIAGVDGGILRRASEDSEGGIGGAFADCLHDAQTQHTTPGDNGDSDAARSRRQSALVQEVYTALATFEKAFTEDWPPSTEQIRAFCDLSGTIRD